MILLNTRKVSSAAYGTKYDLETIKQGYKTYLPYVSILPVYYPRHTWNTRSVDNYNLSLSIKDAMSTINQEAFSTYLVPQVVGTLQEIPYAPNDKQVLVEEFKSIIDLYIHFGITDFLCETFVTPFQLECVIEALNSTEVVESTIISISPRIPISHSIYEFYRIADVCNTMIAFGANCFDARYISDVISLIKKYSVYPIYLAPSAGIPNLQSIYPLSDEQVFDQVFPHIKDISIIGGCCGTTSEYLRLLSPIVRNYYEY